MSLYSTNADVSRLLMIDVSPHVPQGDTSIMGYEVAVDFPHLFPLTPYKTGTCHQGAAFLPKSACDVRRVEFARCLRLLPTALVPISFCVPRVKVSSGGVVWWNRGGGGYVCFHCAYTVYRDVWVI